MLAVMNTSLSPAVIGARRARQGALRVCHGVTFGVVPVEQDQEFVTAEPGDDLGRVVGRFEATGHGHEDLVADLVAEPVVDGLEAIEVEDEDGDRSRGALALGEGVGEAVSEQRPVGQARQRVVEIRMGEGLLGRLVLVLVVEKATDTEVGAGPDDVRGTEHLHLIPFAVHEIEPARPRPAHGVQGTAHRFELLEDGGHVAPRDEEFRDGPAEDLVA